ncbi:MAG: IS200/IS605 family transposase [Verrucomicrobia bacterium]|nr:IS200/IS605 family transposase [Verrucomicrobiota bacterium]
MSQSLSAVYLHLVFSTKDRHPFLRDPALRAETHAYLGGISKQLDCVPIIIGGVDDHVHILAHHARTITQADWVKELKRVSSLWIKQRDPSLRDFAWQSGYGIFSVSASNLETVERYIANQEEHHRKTTFQDEYRAFLKRHSIPWDEKYVWD